MENKTYSIKEVATALDIEDYVLRYYERELVLPIQRNTQGHRIYTSEDMHVLQKVKDYREQGLSIKAIKNILNKEGTNEVAALIQMKASGAIAPQKSGATVLEEMGEGNVVRFMELMRGVFTDVFEEHNEETKHQIKEELSEELSEEVAIMVNKKMREIQVVQAEKDELYYARMDENIREVQRMRREMAVLLEKQPKEKRGMWGKLFSGKRKEEAVQAQEEATEVQ